MVQLTGSRIVWGRGPEEGRTETLPLDVRERQAVPRILVVDDEVRISTFVARALRAEGFAADVATETDEALRKATDSAYDLVLLDLRMPGIGGTGLLAEMIARRPQQRVMILSALADLESKLTCFDLGADDYLEKPFALDELLARVRARVRMARRRERPSAAATAAPPPVQARFALDVERHEVDAGEGPVALSRREFLLLRELVANAGRTVSKPRLLSSVWGYSHDPGSNVVDVCVRRLRAKLGADAITTVRGEGYRVDAHP